ncbi:DsbA family oxidoreductase [Bacillus salinus]|uniref:DsbA family oxidoreductase n=1 Tax=Bacillus sp. HMF5848 TaxID=2495421 RepID=UPI0021AE1059|nr:DsbA family oxidoreductase [Bacillus sp. HMF5848]
MGKKRLEDALKRVEHHVEVVYRSFELNPSASREIDANIYENLSQKYAISLEQAKATTQNVVQMAAEVGLDFQMDKLVLTNTFDAHRLTMLAKQEGKMQEMTDRLLKAYYTEGKHIGDHTTLQALAEEVGLNRETVSNMLTSDTMTDEVRGDEQEATALGINSIPFFLINRKYAITGAQSSEVFVQSIHQIFEQDGQFTQMGETDAVCDENGCEVPEK